MKTPAEIRNLIATSLNLSDLCDALMVAENTLQAAREADLDGTSPDWYVDVGGGIEQMMGICLSDLPTFGPMPEGLLDEAFSWDGLHWLAAEGTRWTIETID